MELNKTVAQSSSSHRSVRGHNIKETKKTRGAYIRGGLITGCIFCLQVDAPITGGLISGGGA